MLARLAGSSQLLRSCSGLGAGVSCAVRGSLEAAGAELRPRRWGHRFMKSNRAQQMWESATGASTSGRKRGRRKGKTFDLNKGQRIGEGLSYNVHLPGFSSEPYSELARADPRKPKPHERAKVAATVVGATVPSFTQLDTKRMETISEIRRKFKQLRRTTVKQTPFERGYSGNRVPGKKITDYLPEELQALGFQAVVLEDKRVSKATEKGHLRRSSVLVAVGNGEGVLAASVGKGQLARSATKAAVTRACRRLEFMERLEDRTVYQDFYGEAAGVRLFVERQAEGAGIVGHRVLRDLCHLVGLKDIKINRWGSSNPQMLVKAFMTGLRHQETFQQLAERKRLHVVEMSKNAGYMPKVVASPRSGAVRPDLPPDEALDLEELYGGGRVPYAKESRKPFFTVFPSFLHARWLEWPFRNHQDLKVRMVADGLVNSWNWRERYAWTDGRQDDVVNGDGVLPSGIGLPPCTRDYLQQDD